MAYDPIQEDCLRLILGTMQREHIYPLENAPFIESCLQSYNHDPASLIKTDRDRSFHLVTLATETIDYRLPFAQDDEAADRVAAEAEAQLREACELDPGNWDARRMLAAVEAESNDLYVGYLLDHRAEVEADYTKMTSAAHNVYEREFANGFGRRPLIRWLAALSARALVAGQYRLALNAAEDCLAFAPDDPADVRLTAMLAMAKLEYRREDLRRFRQKHAASYRSPLPLRRRHHLAEKTQDAWELLSELTIAYHELDFAGATRALRTILQTYPQGAEALYFQAEFPDGVFGRVNVEPGSEDELVLAVSEATPLFQEGLGAPDNAGLAVWIATHELVQEAMQRSAQQQIAHGAAGMGGARWNPGNANGGGMAAGGDN